MLNRILAVIRREYLERVRTKAFWISTLLVPIFLGAIMILPAWLAARGGGEFSVAVLDLSGRFFDPVRDEVNRLLSGDDEKLSVTLVLQDAGPDPGATRERLKNEVQDKRFDGVLVIPATMQTIPSIIFFFIFMSISFGLFCLPTYPRCISCFHCRT